MAASCRSVNTGEGTIGAGQEMAVRQTHWKMNSGVEKYNSIQARVAGARRYGEPQRQEETQGHVSYAVSK